MRKTKVDAYRVFLACALATLCCAGGVAAQRDHDTSGRSRRSVAPAPADPVALVAKLVAQLGSEEYEIRERASAKLQRLLEGPKCETVVAQLRRDLAAATDPEAKRRLEELVKSTELPAPGELMLAVRGVLARTPLGIESIRLVTTLRRGLDELEGDRPSVETLRALVKANGLKEIGEEKPILPGTPGGMYTERLVAQSGRKYWVEVRSEHILKVATVSPEQGVSFSLRDILGPAAHACHIGGSEPTPAIVAKIYQAASEGPPALLAISAVSTPQGVRLAVNSEKKIASAILRSDPPRTPERKEKLEKYLKDVLGEIQEPNEP